MSEVVNFWAVLRRSRILAVDLYLPCFTGCKDISLIFDIIDYYLII